jgi:hypothetical protein
MGDEEAPMDDMGDEEPPMDDMDDMGDEEAAPEMPGDEDPESGEMAPDEEPDMDALMQEVTRRVAARLLKENKK